MNKTVSEVAKTNHHRAYPDFPNDVYIKLQARAKRNYRTVRAEIAALVAEIVHDEEIQEPVKAIS